MSTIILAIAMTWFGIRPSIPAPRNPPPVAVNDEVFVGGYTNYSENTCPANDYDPEGNPSK